MGWNCGFSVGQVCSLPEFASDGRLETCPTNVSDAGLRRREFSFCGDMPNHMESSLAAKTEFCTSEPCSEA